jgi:hypothetical protein
VRERRTQKLIFDLNAQISLTLALQREEAGPISLLRTLNCVVGFVLQKIFLGVPFDTLR